MKKIFFLASLIIVFLSACNNKDTKNDTQMTENPFFTEWKTPFGVPPFDKIKNEHFKPAFEKGMAEQKAEIEAIVNNQEEPDFENTIVALDNSGELLSKVSSVFYNLLSANTSEELQKIAQEVAPELSKHKDDIMMNKKLFERVKAVYDKRESLNLQGEDARLLEETYKEFARNGANLNEKDQEELRKINQRLSVLTLQFGNNVLADVNDYKLVIDNEEDLAGLPESVKAAAAETAKEAGLEGKWVFTTQKPSWIPFLTYAENRELRQKLHTAYTMLGNNNNEHDNKEIIKEIVNLRIRKAHLLGFKNHASYVLDDNMAKTPENVYKLLDQIWNKALPVAKKEAAELQKMIDKEGGNFKLAHWDWWYYAEKLRKEKYDLDESELRQYFQLDSVRAGLFRVVNKLYGLTFKELKDIPKPHPDALAFEVLDADGSHIGVIYMDFFPRASKRSGAWMDAYVKQSFRNGKKHDPVITTVFNFTKPTGDDPALLSFEEVSTMFHEFGHALHGLLSKCKYYSLSGTSVARDFVELPSQIMENWAAEPEVLKDFAKHYKTGEPIPDELIQKIQNSSHFNQGFAAVEYLSASYLDMDWHTLNEPNDNIDVLAFEKASLDKIGLIPEIIVRYRSTYFQHIFSGGYSAGYYSYVWAEVLDADAFAAFKETGDIFNQEVAKKFRENILAKGGSEDPMELYRRFRGKDPSIEPLLKRKGLL